MPPPLPPLRIFALPLSRSAHAPPLIYYHISQHPPPVTASSPSSPSSSSTTLKSPALLAGFDYRAPATWPHWALDKASSTWLGFSRGQKEGSLWKTWQYKMWEGGERLMDRIEFEEWGLKNIDTRLDPWGRVKEPIDLEEDDADLDPAPPAEAASQAAPPSGPPLPPIQLIYPLHPSLSLPPPLSSLTNHLTTRLPTHRRSFRLHLFLSPLTAPFMLVPLIPNLPFFYMLWRAWSGWRAARGAEWVLELVERGRIVEVGDKELGGLIVGAVREAEVVGREKAPDGTETPKEMVGTVTTASGETKPISKDLDSASSTTVSSSSIDATSPASELLFPASLIPTFASRYQFSDAEVVDLRRAVEQARGRLEKERKEEGQKVDEMAKVKAGEEKGA